MNLLVSLIIVVLSFYQTWIETILAAAPQSALFRLCRLCESRGRWSGFFDRGGRRPRFCHPLPVRLPLLLFLLLPPLRMLLPKSKEPNKVLTLSTLIITSLELLLRNEVVVLQSAAQPLPGGVIYPPGCELQQATSGLQLQQPGVHQAQPGIFQPQPAGAGGYFVYFPSSEQQAIEPHCNPDQPPPYPGLPQGGPGNNQEHCPKLKEPSPTKDPQPSPAIRGGRCLLFLNDAMF